MSLLMKLGLSFLRPAVGVDAGTIGDSFSERNERFKSPSAGNVAKVGVSNEVGVIPLRSTDDINTSKYKWVYFGDVFYNPMRLNVGSVALYESEVPSITSPDYVVVKPNSYECGWLLYTFLKSNIGISEIKKRTKGSVRERVYFDSLSAISFPRLSEEMNRKAKGAHQFSMKTIAMIQSLQTVAPSVTSDLGGIAQVNKTQLRSRKKHSQ